MSKHQHPALLPPSNAPLPPMQNEWNQGAVDGACAQTLLTGKAARDAAREAAKALLAAANSNY